ncbi:hypothetical protein [Profundibacter sp.]|uniref:hypothetical protein n=1 Tax=Profundibacter sp. TaxID=3101071 RepID=UPI003D14C36E
MTKPPDRRITQPARRCLKSISTTFETQPEQELIREINSLEQLGLLGDLEDLGVMQRLKDHGPIVDPELEMKVIELKEMGYLDSLDISELILK